MPRQRVTAFFSRRGLSPYLTFAKNAMSTKPEIDHFLSKKLSETKLPFVILNVGSLTHDKELLEHAQATARRLGVERKKKELIMDQPNPQIRTKLNLWLSRRFPKSLSTTTTFFQRQTKAICQFSRMKPLSQNNTLFKMNAFLNGPRMSKVNKKIGFNYYQAKLEKWLAAKPGEPPSRVKDYLRKIVKSKYFYWFLLYKVIGLCLKIGFVLYMLFFRNKTPAPGSLVKPENTPVTPIPSKRI